MNLSALMALPLPGLPECSPHSLSQSLPPAPLIYDVLFPLLDHFTSASTQASQVVGETSVMSAPHVYLCNPSTPASTPFPASVASPPASALAILPAAGEPELIVPQFITAGVPAAAGLLPLPPHTTSDEELAVAKALLSPSAGTAYAIANSTPYASTPLPHVFNDLSDACAVVEVTFYTLMPPSLCPLWFPLPLSLSP